VRVRIYHSTERSYRFGSWAPAAAMTLVDDYEPTGANFDWISPKIPIRLLELVWREHNAVDGNERCCQLGVRSLSVGDVVQLDERAFAAELVGWREINPHELRLEV
jgi:hypothetical protein